MIILKLLVNIIAIIIIINYYYKDPDSKIVADVILMDDSDALIKINELLNENKKLHIEIDALNTKLFEIANNQKNKKSKFNFFTKLK